MRRIRFRFDGLAGPITVDPSTFDRVSTAIQRDQIRVADGAGVDGFTSTMTGAYEGGGNCFYVRRTGQNSRVWDGTVVHESVHASIDLTRSHIAIADNEAAAFLASAMFFVMTGLPATRWRHDATWEEFVRQTAVQALSTGQVSNAAMVRFRERILKRGYNDHECGLDVHHPLFETGNG